MNAEPLDVALQPGMEPGTFVDAEAVPSSAALSKTSGRHHGPTTVASSSVVVPETVVAAPASHLSQATMTAASDSSSPFTSNPSSRAKAGAAGASPDQHDADYDPEAPGDFDYPPMPPQECCGCRPELSACCYLRRMGRAYICRERLGSDPKVGQCEASVPFAPAVCVCGVCIARVASTALIVCLALHR
jgi:hypothetical protein